MIYTELDNFYLALWNVHRVCVTRSAVFCHARGGVVNGIFSEGGGSVSVSVGDLSLIEELSGLLILQKMGCLIDSDGIVVESGGGFVNVTNDVRRNVERMGAEAGAVPLV